jgi:hypothetical protein
MEPIPDPRIARFSCFEYRYFRGQLEWRIRKQPWEEPGPWLPDGLTPDDYAAVAALKDHPTEDQEEAAA